MTPQERQLVDDLFDRLGKVEAAPRDPDAQAAIADGLRRAPNAIYALVQTVLLQDEALKRAHDRITELEGNGAPAAAPAGGFLDSMRDALFGQSAGQTPPAQPRGSVPSVRPAEPSRAAWNTGQVIGQPQQGGYGQGGYAQGGYGQGQYGQPPMGQQPQGGGGSFLGTAAAAAAGMVGGSLLLGSIRSMMGGHQQGFGDSASAGESRSPWSSDSSSSDLAKSAGVNDIGNSSGQGAGSFDQAQADADQDQDQDQDDHDDMDLDSDDFGGGGDDDSNFA
ncbi:MAG: transporter substrate-binding protein [Tardiphaga sp.]|jgi:hypothetical protein|nr:transporter substrate-binding protein [Tardiphaga sp.]